MTAFLMLGEISSGAEQDPVLVARSGGPPRRSRRCPTPCSPSAGVEHRVPGRVVLGAVLERRQVARDRHQHPEDGRDQRPGPTGRGARAPGGASSASAWAGAGAAGPTPFERAKRPPERPAGEVMVDVGGLRHSCGASGEGFGGRAVVLVELRPRPARRGRGGSTSGRQSSIGPMPDSPGEAARFLTRNAVEALPEGELERQLEQDRPLRVKLGVDPTTPDIHLGHTVVLRKLREFQDLGHTVVLIIGDYTARVGDPSGRSSARPDVDPAEIDRNADTYQEQAFKVLDRERTEVRRNGEWLDMPMEDLFRLARTVHGGADARARRLRQALRGRPPDLDPRAALPAAPGLRLGGRALGRGARRHRPEVQRAPRARHPAGLRRGAAVGPDHADPARDRRRAEDVEVARQLRGRGRAARGGVRQAHARPRHRDAHLLRPADGRAARPGAARRATRSARSRARSPERLHGPEAAAAAPRRTSTGCTWSAACPTTSRSTPSRATTAPSTCPRCSPTRSASRAPRGAGSSRRPA